jgi:hypothetical protein
MNKNEQREMSQMFFSFLAGILFNNQNLSATGEVAEIVYDFAAPEFATLKAKYALDTIAKTGSDFRRALRLMNFLSPRLTHAGNYDNHVECNALALLEYSLNQPNHGINCLNKAKILAECCLAVGIYARRVRIMPYSPYDFDNHVVTEIYDRKRRKWMLLDPTTNGYFVDEKGVPLSCMEIRDHGANDRFFTLVIQGQPQNDYVGLFDKNLRLNAYILKNLFYLQYDQHNGFGVKESMVLIAPAGFDVQSKEVANWQFRLNQIDRTGGRTEYKQVCLNRLQKAKEKSHPVANVQSVLIAPISK